MEKCNGSCQTSIILTFDAGLMDQTIQIIYDGDKTAKELWEAPALLFSSSNEHTVINLLQELESLELKYDGNWDNHLNKFQEILGTLSSLGEPISDEKKVSKLIRTLSDHFAPLSMVSSHMGCDKMVNPVEADCLV